MTTWREVAELGPELGLCAPCTYLPPEGTTRPRHEGVLPWGYIKTQPGLSWFPPATEEEDEVPLRWVGKRTRPPRWVEKRTRCPLRWMGKIHSRRFVRRV